MKSTLGFLTFISLFTAVLFLDGCKKDPVIPILTTNEITSITINSGISGGVITDDGGADITARGVCWSTTANPVITGSHTSNGMGTGSFTSSITSLEPYTLYYVRAYATNSAGTGYGSEVTFTTSPVVVATLSTTTATSVSLTTAVSGGNITADGGGAVTARGVCWSVTANPTVSGSKTTDGTGTGVYASNLTGLTPATTYYIRSYATNSAGTAYGNEITITTNPIVVATLSTTAVTSVTLTSGVTGGNITADGGGSVTARGVCWATTENPTIANSKTSDATGTGVFTSNITGLQPAVTYYVRAYATNSAGTAYGSQVSFTTNPVLVASLTTAEATSVTLTTATLGGTITSDGGGAVTARGVCYSTSAEPTLSDDITTNGSGTGSFTSNLTGLTPGTTYFVRAYATNSAGTAYGTEVSFETDPIVVPTLTTAAASSVTLTTAVTGGNVTADGGGAVTSRGVCYSTAANPDINDDKTSNGTGTGSFTSNLSGLTPGTTYYVRAYATNSAGTAYGAEISFATTPIVVPTLTTTTVSSITLTTASSGGNISSAGGGTVSARGVCYATTENPTTANFITTNGTGTGVFTSSLTSLLPGTTYYLRAYATNSAGTAYGNEVSFTTDPVVVPTVTTTAISAITATTASTGGGITNDGGGSITAKGVCYSVTTNPTISSSITTDGTGTAGFTSSLTGLLTGTRYYVRAYATNSAGTGYGPQVIFDTRLADRDGNTYSIVTIGTQVWMAENLKTTVLNDNTPIPNVTDNAAWAALSTPGYSYYGNNAAAFRDLYGAMYNWYAVGTGDLCPTGWHVPTDAEFGTLEVTLGMAPADVTLFGTYRGTTELVGSQLKNTTGWNAGENGTNTSGFSALPGGYRYFLDGTFQAEEQWSYWWSSDIGDGTTTWYRRLDGLQNGVFRGAVEYQAGKYVRCIKD